MTNDNRIYCPFCGKIMVYDAFDEQAICNTVNCKIEQTWVEKKVWSRWALSAEATNAFDQFRDSLQHEKDTQDHLVATMGRLINNSPYSIAEMHDPDSDLNKNTQGVFAEALKIVLGRKQEK